MTRKRRSPKREAVWTWGRPLPSFETEEEELAFWASHEFEPPPDGVGEELVYEPQATRQARKHVYRVRLNDEEMALLQELAQKRGVPASTVIRELIKIEASSAS